MKIYMFEVFCISKHSLRVELELQRFFTTKEKAYNALKEELKLYNVPILNIIKEQNLLDYRLDQERGTISLSIEEVVVE